MRWVLYWRDFVFSTNVSDHRACQVQSRKNSPSILVKIVTILAEMLVAADAHDHFTVLWLSAAQPRAR